MHSIALYLELGLKHISDLVGYDHILFLVALCAVYRVRIGGGHYSRDGLYHRPQYYAGALQL